MMRIDENNVFHDTYLINSYDVDQNYRANLSLFFKLVQDVAGNHAYLKGCALPHLNKEGKTWVVTRSVLDIFDYPWWPEYVDIETFPLQYSGYLAPRGTFISKQGGGELLARCFSNWCILDIEHGHRPVKPDFLTQRLGLVNPEAERYRIGSRRDKIDSYDDIENIRCLNMRKAHMSYTDSDYNGHINNISYLNWIISGLPASFLKDHLASHVDISWLKETHLDDELAVHIGSADAGALSGCNDEVRLYAKILRHEEDGSETCVCTACLDFRPIAGFPRRSEAAI